MNPVDFLRDPVWQGLGVIISILLFFVSVYLEKKQAQAQQPSTHTTKNLKTSRRITSKFLTVTSSVIGLLVLVGFLSLMTELFRPHNRIVVFNDFKTQEDTARNWPIGSRVEVKDATIYTTTLQSDVYRWDTTSTINILTSLPLSVYDIPGNSLTDFTLSVDFKKTSGPDGLPFGIKFRSGGQLEYYLFQINNQQNYSFSKRTPEERVEFIPRNTRSSAIKPNEWNNLKVVTRGFQIELYINNQLVGRFYDTSYNSGLISLAQSIVVESSSISTSLEIDNFSLKTP